MAAANSDYSSGQTWLAGVLRRLVDNRRLIAAVAVVLLLLALLSLVDAAVAVVVLVALIALVGAIPASQPRDPVATSPRRRPKPTPASRTSPTRCPIRVSSSTGAASSATPTSAPPRCSRSGSARR
jgi:hypothetical protein